MGFAVLHIQKPKGNDARTSAHIERTIQPTNADPERTYLNKELVNFLDTVENRTQAIQHRIEHAGITRKISHNQIRALQVMLSGTHEDMQRIQSNGQLDEWCNDNMEWLQNTFGKDNVVSAVLHMDEKTPHIHATVVPIVQGERRKAKSEHDNDKKKYRKKPKGTARLCADDVMTRDNLARLQDSYAERMAKYGLGRGVKGSDARHISTPQYYRDLCAKNEVLRGNINYLEKEEQEVYEKTQDLYDLRDEAKEKFLNINEHLKQQKDELAAIEAKLQTAEQKYEPYKAQEDINLLLSLFPKLSGYLPIAQLCKAIGLTVETIKKLFNRETITLTGTLHSPEHKQNFEAKDICLKIEKEPDNPGKFRLTLNGEEIQEWFKRKYQDLQRTIRIKPAQPIKTDESRGFRM